MVDGVFFFVSNRRKSACGKIQARGSPPSVQVLTEWFTIQPHSSQLSSTTARHQVAEETATNSPAMAGLLVSRSNKNTKTQSPYLHTRISILGR
jgi:sugar phosphate permease